MANKSLGLAGAEVVMPGTFTIAMPISMSKQIDKGVMSDRSFRWAIFKKHRVWELTWTYLTAADLALLVTANDHNVALRWQNLDESAVWHNVIVTEFAYDSVDPMPAGAAVVSYKATMTLEEAV